jgi:hypothetical protein
MNVEERSQKRQTQDDFHKPAHSAKTPSHRDIPGEVDERSWRCVNCGEPSSFEGDGQAHACRSCGNITWVHY